jgi:predicted HicB family RNase H-like nuclease
MFREATNQKPDAQFMVRFEPATLARIKEKARAMGISATAWVRLACKHALAFDVVGGK